MIGTNLSGKSIILPPNQVQTISVTGRYLIILASSMPFTVSFDGGEEVPAVQGLAIPADDIFTHLTFRDTSGGGVTITFLTSVQPIAFFPPTTNVIQTNSPTTAKATGSLVLGAGATDAYSGLNGVKARKLFVVTNLDVALNLNLQDGAGNSGITLYPNTPTALETNSALKVNNPNGGALNYEVLEIFYS